MLDLATGSYVGIDAKYLHDLRIRIPNWPKPHRIEARVPCAATAASESLVATLCARGILTTCDTPARSTLPPSAVSTLKPGASPKQGGAPMRHLFPFAVSLLIAFLRHRDEALASLVNWLSRRQESILCARRSPTLRDVERLVASFLRLRIWFYTADRRCLFDSLVLAVFLTRKMVPCTFVIGVSTKPFLAHSWVQIKDLVVNDTVEHVQMFTPILAAGDLR